MAEVDTSSYPKAGGNGKSPLELATQFGQAKALGQMIQRNAIGIDKDKLDLVNKQWELVNHEFSTLIGKPDLNAEDIVNSGQNLVKLGIITPDQFAQHASQIPSKTATERDLKQRYPNITQPEIDNQYKNVLQQHIQQALTRGQTTQDAINFHYGTPGTVNNGNTTTPVVTSAKPGFGVRPIGAPIQNQLPPTTEINPLPTYDTKGNIIDPGGKRLLGAQLPMIPPGTLPVQGGLPGQYQSPNQNAPIVPKRVKTVPAAPNGLPVAAAVGEPATPNERIAQGFNNLRTGMPPGYNEAAETAGHGSGEQLAEDRRSANNFQREIFPLTQAIPALERLGTKGTGPGTETINHIKSFVLSNVPGVKPSDFDGTVADYDKAKKYLTDYVNQIGNSGTNDKLAAAFAGNPSVNISNAAAQDVAKSALALRRMKQAQQIEWEKAGLSDNQYASWAAKWNNNQDPRAYGFDLMSDEKKQKMLKSMDAQELTDFKRSLGIAHRAKIGLEAPKKKED